MLLKQKTQEEIYRLKKINSSLPHLLPENKQRQSFSLNEVKSVNEGEKGETAEG